MSKTLTSIATQLVAKNSTITEVITTNPGKSYKALEPIISAKLCSRIGKAEGTYIKRNELIWACINEVEDDEEELDY